MSDAKSSEKLVMCGYLGCRNMFYVDPRKGVPLVPICPHHVKRMNQGIRMQQRKRMISHG